MRSLMSAPGQLVDARETRRVFGYFAVLLLVVSIVSPQGALAQIPIQFYLKDQLRLSPEGQATFQFLMSIPLYGAFLFGLGRDRLFASGVRDRSLFIFFAPITALAYVALAFAHATYSQLLIGAMAATLIFRALAPAIVALQATVGQGLRMTGRISVLQHVVGSVVGAALVYLAGKLNHYFSPQTIFLIVAGFALLLLVVGLKSPQTVDAAEDAATPQKRSFGQDLGRLLRHRAVWPAVLIYLMWEFAPASGTPMLNYLTGTLHLTDTEYTLYRSIVRLSLIPGFLLYGVLCRRVNPRKLLFWSVAFGVPQMIPLIFVNSPMTAYLAAGWFGLVGGMASAAIYDVLLRSCPRGFEGFAMELAVTGVALSDQLGNVWGAHLYQNGGFVLTNLVTTAVYALILPLLLLIPRSITERRDAEEDDSLALAS